jgi:hypothetical protein
VTPAVKFQISPMPGTLDLSATVGVGLPTGAASITGPGVQPYVQFPCSWELVYGWSLRGMATLFFRPSDPISQLTTEPTFVIEKKVGERADVFVEYVGDFPDHAGSRHLLQLGRRLSPHADAANRFPCRPRSQPQCPKLGFRLGVFDPA